MFLEYYHDTAERKRTARTMMICLVVAAMIGGMITPAGCSVNLIGIDMLERYAGTSIRFIDWIKVGLPVAIVMLGIAYRIITLVYPPAEIRETELKAYIDSVSQKRQMTKMDIYTGVLIFVIIGTWIASSWIPAINITVTSLIGLALMFIPGFSVLNWEEFVRENSWGAFFVAGNHISLAQAVITTGLCDFFTEVLFHSQTGGSKILIAAWIAAVTFVFMAIIPSAPAVGTILSPVIINFALSTGLNPVMALMTSLLCIPNIYLFPLDAPLIVAYDKKAFTMFEMPKATLWIQLAMIGVLALWIPWIFQFI
jgi:sodium-dependent dicarboxylate transporter 2/3/5